ncbi:MAG: nucleotide exchange factor GrpE [Gammaproteobacteria bacterium]|nr:nucleotide exchange factor GrpE [Chromatiales bacterium]MYE48066.1 nucleotide exchange factor GrpE [Gammaproteobacteria bacterium]
MSKRKQSEEPEAEGTADAAVSADAAESAEPEDPAKQIEGLKAALNEQHEAHLRAVAEAENVRRRAQREISNAYGRGQRQIAREFLASIDALELGLSSADGATAETLLEGQQATLRQLLKALEQFGVEAVDPEGEPFDPEHHEAVSMQPSDSVAADSVIAVMQKGYLMQGSLLRAARVVVCSGPPEAAEPANDADD